MSNTDISPAAPNSPGTQIAVTGPSGTVTPSSRPFILYTGTDLTGTATGDPEVRSYCARPDTEASRYRLNRDDHNQIVRFTFTANGTTGPAYCLDKFKDGPYGDVPYQSQTFETLFPDATERQKQMLAWILANAYPTVSASQTFNLVGVDDTAAPPLDNNDAYAAVQVAIWVLLGQISPSEAVFLNCSDGAAHPKSDRLNQTVLRLIEMAGNFADTAAQPAYSYPPGTGASCCRQEFIYCCNTGTIPSNPSESYLVFHGCPSEIRNVCGRLLVGPFSLRSSLTGTPVLTIETFCNCGEDFSASFMDFCGNPITSPAVGQEFYIALRLVHNAMCFRVNASLSGTVTRVVLMDPTAETTLNYQPIGATLEDYPVTTTASICVCIVNPSIHNSGSSGKGGICITNNNSNSTNNNNNNNQSGTMTIR